MENKEKNIYFKKLTERNNNKMNEVLKMRFILVISLILLLLNMFSSPIPQFTEEQMQIICVQEGI